MQTVVSTASGILNLCISLFSSLMGNWVTSLFFIGCILVLILDVVISSSSGDEKK